MNEIIDDNKVEPLPSSLNVVEDSIASRTKESTKRPKRERSPTLQIPTPLPKVKKIKEVAPKLPDKTKWTLEEQKQFFSALRIYGKNFEALGQCFNTRRRLINPEAQKRTFGQIRCFYYRSFRTVSKLCTFTEEEKSNVDSLELRSVLAYLCLKPKLKCFDKKPAITVLHQLIRNGNAFLRIKGQREHVSIIGKALKPPKTTNTLGSAKQTDRLLSKHIKIVLSPASANAYMRVALSCRYPHVEVLLTRTATIFELIDKLTHYWQLTSHAQTLFKDDVSQEQMILYPHLSYLSSSTTNTVDLSSISTDIVDSSSKKQMTMSTDKQFRSRSDSEHSTEPMNEPSSLTRKRSNPSESETSNEVSSTTTSTMTNNKSNLARTAILLAAKRAASTNTNTNNYDTSTFALMENVEDESDSNGGLLKQRFDILDLIDDFPSEDEIEPDTNVPTTISMANNISTLTLSDLSQGISKSNCLFSTMTIGELQKILQRPKEIRLTYDFNNLSRTTNSNESSSSTAFLHYVIQIANQCLTSIADRQSSIETKVTKKPNAKKHQTSRTRCYCSCCSHSHSINSRDQRRPGIKTTNSPNTELCVPIQMPIVSETISSNNNEEISAVPLDCDLHDKSRVPLSSQMDEQVGIFDNMTRSHDTGTRSFETNQSSTVELPSVSTLLLPMTSTNESTSIPSQPVKQAAVMFSSNNGVIDDPLIQSLAAEQAASAHNYDLLSHRHKRVRRPLRYGDQSTRSTNIQLLLDANFNAHQTTTTTTTTTVVNKHFALSTNNTPDISSSSDNLFSGDCENPNDLLNDNTNMSTISLSTTIVNAALQSNTSRLRLDWLDNMSDLSFGSFPDLLESNTLSSIPDEINNFEQSTVN